MPASKFTVKTLSRVVAKSESSSPASEKPHGRLQELTEELRDLEIQRLCGLIEQVECAYLTYTNAQEAARQIVAAVACPTRSPDRTA